MLFRSRLSKGDVCPVCGKEVGDDLKSEAHFVSLLEPVRALLEEKARRAPGVPVRVVLSLGADGLQQINGVSDEILVHFTVGPMHSMISQNRQIAVSPTQLDGQQIAPLLFRDASRPVLCGSPGRLLSSWSAALRTPHPTP